VEPSDKPSGKTPDERRATAMTALNKYSATLSLLALVVGMIPDTTHADQPSAMTATKPVLATNVGLKECAACHSNPSPIYQQLDVTQFVRLVESTEWLQRDKHAYAYELIKIDGLSPDEMGLPNRQSNQRSLTILQNLQWNVTHDTQTNQWIVKDDRFAQQCLTCHVGSDHRKPLPDPKVLQFGVQCESCHGPGSEYIQTQNHQQTSWRAKSPDQKAQLGMWNLGSPTETAKICYSCHMGDLSQNRFITHQFYAAGHPPLPPVELQTFLDAMPPHWRTLQEKPYPTILNESASTRDLLLKPNVTEEFEMQREYLQANFGPIRSGRDYETLKEEIRNDFPRTRRAMIGGLVAKNVGLEMIHQLAEDTQRWGDYAIYDCMGCHQELRKPTQRMVSLGRVPGRAYPHRWWISETPLESLSDPLPLKSVLQTTLDSFDRFPFGDREQIALSADNHLEQLQQQSLNLKAIERAALSPTDVRYWVAQLIREREPMLYDYWTAKQTAWMVRVATEELISHNALPQSAVRTDLNALKEMLNLQLKTNAPQSSILISLPSTLATARDFHADECIAIFRSILETIELNKSTE
jgi:hypothetical protein